MGDGEVTFVMSAFHGGVEVRASAASVPIRLSPNMAGKADDGQIPVPNFSLAQP